MNFTPAKTIAGISRELGVSRQTIYLKLDELKLAPKDVLLNRINALKLYASVNTKYLLLLADELQKPSIEVSDVLSPADNLNRVTVYRFSKDSGIPVDQLDRVLLAKLVGSHRDPVTAYKDLLKFKQLKHACMLSGTTWEQLHNFAKHKC